tara:strand:+ start:437 stop:934 length:498 start_codon:yes stop_codon:yes gene_type:complete
LPNEVLTTCDDADRVIHAGDVGSEAIITDLESLAPLTFVGGNIDPVNGFPSQSKLILNTWKIFVQHIGWEKGKPFKELKKNVDLGEYEIVVFGHSHKPLCSLIGETIYLNPGSCGPRRFDSDCTFCEICIDENVIDIRFYKLTDKKEKFLQKTFKKTNGKLYDCC